MKHPRMTCLALAVVVFVTLVAGCSKAPVQQAEELPTITMRLGHSTADTHPYTSGARKLAEEVAARTDGKFKIEVYPAGQLGGERDIMEGLQAGTIELTVTSLGVAATFVPEINLFNLPFLFKGVEHYNTVVQGEIGRKILDAADANDLKGLGFCAPVFRVPMNDKRPLNTPADFRGLKIRLMEVPLHMDTYRALGASPVPIAFGELYTALQLGTVDGCENAIATLYTQKFYEVQKYLTMVPVFSNGAVFFIGKQAWDKLPEEYQDALMDSIPAAVQVLDEDYLRLENEGLAAMQQRGLQVNTPADLGPFHTATESVYATYLQKLPPWVGELVPQIRALGGN